MFRREWKFRFHVLLPSFHLSKSLTVIMFFGGLLVSYGAALLILLLSQLCAWWSESKMMIYQSGIFSIDPLIFNRHLDAFFVSIYFHLKSIYISRLFAIHFNGKLWSRADVLIAVLTSHVSLTISHPDTSWFAAIQRWAVIRPRCALVNYSTIGFRTSTVHQLLIDTFRLLQRPRF